MFCIHTGARDFIFVKVVVTKRSEPDYGQVQNPYSNRIKH